MRRDHQVRHKLREERRVFQEILASRDNQLLSAVERHCECAGQEACSACRVWRELRPAKRPYFPPKITAEGPAPRGGGCV